MYGTHLIALCLLVASGGLAYAQNAVVEAAPDELIKDVVADTAEAEISVTPSLAEIAASDPALSIREGENGEVDAMAMMSDVLFGFSSDTLEPEALTLLSSIAESLEDAPAIRIKGHTDAIGDEESNRLLGQRRADNVRDWLVSNTNLTPEMIISVGVGEADPIAENLTEDGGDNPDGRAQNRRVEFILLDALGRVDNNSR